MIDSDSPLFQTLLGTLFTWGMTAAGAGLVVFINGTQRKLLDASLGFAAGVMTAASYWSLLAPAIEMAEESQQYGAYAFFPAALGFLIGSLFVYATDVLITAYGLQSAGVMLAYGANGYSKKTDSYHHYPDDDERPAETATIEGFYEDPYNQARRRGPQYPPPLSPPSPPTTDPRTQWKRLLLLIVAITVHNVPEGLAVGVGNAAIGSTPSATYQSARNLAIGIGLQNFPEGLAVSLPLKTAGFSTFRSFWYGQLSGMVEPVAGLLGVLAISLSQPLLPYALAFAAGAMIYVVFDDIIPEAHSRLNCWDYRHTLVDFLKTLETLVCCQPVMVSTPTSTITRKPAEGPPMTKKPRSRIAELENQRENLIQTALTALQKHEDEFDAVGKSVAAKLRKMKENQTIHAEKLISDTLYKGLLDQLTEHTCISDNASSIYNVMSTQTGSSATRD